MGSSQLYAKTSPVKLFFYDCDSRCNQHDRFFFMGIIRRNFCGKFDGGGCFRRSSSGVSICTINFSLADLIGAGSSVNISIFLGKKENDEANNYFTCSCLMIIITGVIFFFAAPWLMQFMGAEKELADLAI